MPHYQKRGVTHTHTLTHSAPAFSTPLTAPGSPVIGSARHREEGKAPDLCRETPRCVFKADARTAFRLGSAARRPRPRGGSDVCAVLRRGQMSPGSFCHRAVGASCRPGHLMARTEAKASDSPRVLSTDAGSFQKEEREGGRARKEGGVHLPRSLLFCVSILSTDI